MADVRFGFLVTIDINVARLMENQAFNFIHWLLFPISRLSSIYCALSKHQIVQLVLVPIRHNQTQYPSLNLSHRVNRPHLVLT